MAPTLNQDDIKLLKGIFATKEDLGLMENRFNKKFATKDDLKDFAKKDDLKNLATKEDLKPLATTKQLKTEIKMSEMRIIKRMGDMDNFLDRETVRLAKDIDKLKPSSVQYV